MITLRHTTHDRTSPDDRSARSIDLYLTTHNTYKRQTYMSLAGFEPVIPASEWKQTARPLESTGIRKHIQRDMELNVMVVGLTA
jgi:hypothetical protein